MQPTHLKSWTDAQIWQLYGIHGQDIERFRIEAQSSGKPPQWVEANATPNATLNLLRDSLRWMHPTMSAVERQALLQSYNLLPSQQRRLQQDLKTDLTLPQWVKTHQQLIEDIDNPNRLDQFGKDVIDELNLRRDARHGWYDPEISLTSETREALLPKMGYLRNQNNLLYRTDVPALFRGDDRAPFELARDNAMLPRHRHGPGATTHKPMSATFRLDAARMYGKAPDPDYLRFNSQANKYPGRSADNTPLDTSDVESRDSDWSDIGSPVGWDHERNYERIRERQKVMFLYALDTRGKEVVPREENTLFNSAAQKNPAWFPEDDYEGLISVTKKGLEADRIWLLNSSLTKGARVTTIEELAGFRADSIEESTYTGKYNTDEYDKLIDQAETAGYQILKLSGNKNEYGDDVRWP